MMKTFVEKDFWSEVFGGSAESVGSSFNNFSEPEIREFKVSIISDKEVLRLQVPVDDILGMQVLELQGDLSSVESILGF
jgi:hypothetical protein